MARLAGRSTVATEQPALSGPDRARSGVAMLPTTS